MQALILIADGKYVTDEGTSKTMAYWKYLKPVLRCKAECDYGTTGRVTSLTSIADCYILHKLLLIVIFD